MSDRQIAPELQALYDAGIPVYSISRLDCINHCLYEAYRSYKIGQRGDNNIYGLLGTKIHDTLERITNGEATEADLLPAMEQELMDAELFGYEFPKDSSGGNSIRDGWIADMTQFCKTYEVPRPGFNTKTEDFFLYKTPKGRYVQGYIDLQYLLPHNHVAIYDYKTSTKYSGEAVKEHARQLILYGLAAEQAGMTVELLGWDFLKYAEISFHGKKNSRSKEKVWMSKKIERRKIGIEMSKYVEDDMLERGYSELECEFYLGKFEKSNLFSDLPEEIASLYQTKNCYVYVDFDEAAKRECIDYIDSTIDMWEALGDNEANYPPLKFERVQKNGKVVPDIFYCTKLCGHAKKCPYLSEYLDTHMKNDTPEEDDLF